MASERQPPDAVLASSGLTGGLVDIDEDPDSPDGNWMVATGNNTNTTVRTSFGTPTGNPTIGADLQKFKAWVRQYDENQGGTPDCRLELWENGGLIRAGSDTPVPDGGLLLSFTWNANEIATSDGSLIECKIVGTKSGGSPGNRNTVDMGAVEWNVTYSAEVIEWLAGVSDGIASVVGDTKISKKIDGLTVGVAVVSGDTKVSKKILGTIAGIASVSGATDILKKLTGVCAGIAVTSGLTNITKKITGTISGVCSTTGSLTVAAGEILLAGIIAGIAGVTGAVKVTRTLVGSVVGLTSVSGVAKTTKRIAGTINGIASVAGDLSIGAFEALAGVISGIASVSGAVKVSKKIAGITVGICQTTGVTKVIRKLIGAVSGIANVIADLTISGVPDVYEATILDLTEPEESTITSLNIVKAITPEILDLHEPEEVIVEVLKL